MCAVRTSTFESITERREEIHLLLAVHTSSNKFCSDLAIKMTPSVLLAVEDKGSHIEGYFDGKKRKANRGASARWEIEIIAILPTY